MIVLSNSLPKTGSTLIANYQEDILEHLGKHKGQNFLRSKYKGRYVNRPGRRLFLDLVFANMMRGSVVVKCHWDPSKKLDRFCRMARVRMTMTYRDPRDIIISMINHGERSRAGKDRSGAFMECNDVVELIPRAKGMMENLKVWRDKKYVHCIRYEELMNHPEQVLKDMIGFIGWKVPHTVISQIVAERERTKQSSWNFNTGKTGRWREEMSNDEIRQCDAELGDYLSEFGYDPGNPRES